MAPIQLTVQAIRAARVSPSSWHLRAICNYLESRLAGWFEQQTKPCSQSAESPSVSSEASSAWTTTAKACNPNGNDGESTEQSETNSKTKYYSIAVSQTRLRGSGKSAKFPSGLSLRAGNILHCSFLTAEWRACTIGCDGSIGHGSHFLANFADWFGHRREGDICAWTDEG